MKARPKASHYINGRFVEDEQGTPLEVIYPATGEVIATLHSATAQIIEQAMEAAREAQLHWPCIASNVRLGRRISSKMSAESPRHSGPFVRSRYCINAATRW